MTFPTREKSAKARLREEGFRIFPLPLIIPSPFKSDLTRRAAAPPERITPTGESEGIRNPSVRLRLTSPFNKGDYKLVRPFLKITTERRLYHCGHAGSATTENVRASEKS